MEGVEVIADNLPAVAPVETLNHEVVVPNQESLPTVEALTIEAAMPPVAPVQQIEPSMEQLPPEQLFYQQQQPPRPISEVLGTGSFFFLQESEIDTPPEQIPSQTFTNQSFVTAPPPPIPMPPHFQAFPGNIVPPAGNGVEEHPEIPDDTHKQRGRSRPNNQPFYPNNNGYNRSRQNRNGPRPGNRHNQ